MIRQAAVILISLITVVIASLFAYAAVWLLSAILTPFWLGLVTIFSWIVGFALGTRLFWNTVTTLPAGRKTD